MAPAASVLMCFLSSTDSRRTQSVEAATTSCKKRKLQGTAADSDPGTTKKPYHYHQEQQQQQQQQVQQSAVPPVTAQQSNIKIFDLPPANISDRFDFDATTLGTGQFGTVRKCTDRLTGTRMACKTLSKARIVTAVQADEVRREAQAMLRVAGHEGIVQLRGVYEDDQSVHFVMDLCEGGELFDEVLRRKRFEERDAAHVFAQIVSAVAMCHERGVIHRDLKPENILLPSPSTSTSSPEPLAVKLADFGLAALPLPGQKAYGVTGSPYYMAPEVLSGAYDSKADIWSLGVILYILLSGSPPFWGEGDQGVFDAILAGQVDFSFSPWHSVSADAKRLVKCMLAKNPSQRPSARKVLTHPWLVRHLALLNSSSSTGAAVEAAASLDASRVYVV